MLSLVLAAHISLAFTEPVAPSDTALRPADGAATAPGEPAALSVPDLLSQARDALAEGRIERALELLDEAMELDPSFAAVYLMRVQLLLDALGDLDAPPSEAAARRRWIEWARQAALDLERYIALAELSESAAAEFEVERLKLLLAIKDAEDRSSDSATSAPSPPPDELTPPGQDRGGDSGRDTDSDKGLGLGLGLAVGGGVLSGTAIGLWSISMHVQRRCLVESCIVDPRAEWSPRVPPLAIGASATLVGAGLLTAGTMILATRGSSATRRRRRILGISMLCAAAVAGGTSLALSSVTARRWATRDVTRREDLSQIQSLANASLAFGSVVIPLLGGGIGLMLPGRGER